MMSELLAALYQLRKEPSLSSIQSTWLAYDALPDNRTTRRQWPTRIWGDVREYLRNRVRGECARVLPHVMRNLFSNIEERLLSLGCIQVWLKGIRVYFLTPQGSYFLTYSANGTGNVFISDAITEDIIRMFTSWEAVVI